MYIKSVRLKDFRNYSKLDMAFANGINVLYGDNAQGKTNILEAIFIGATTFSHRGAKKEELVSLGAGDSNLENAYISLIIQKKYTENKIDINIRKNKKNVILVDGVPIRRAADLIGLLQLVFFAPEDLDIIRRGPAERRKAFDINISSVNRIYFKDLIKFNKILNSRNKLLKDISKFGKKSDLITLDILDEQFAAYAENIIKERKKFTDELNEEIKPIHRNISGGEDLFIEYAPHCGANDLKARLTKSRDRDIRSGTTNVGPHRDDYVFKINSLDAKAFASQGQKRTAAVSFKLSQMKINEKHTGEEPILLLDDVLSELDLKRRDLLFENICGKQIIIACTGEKDWIEGVPDVKKVYEIKNGAVNRGWSRNVN